MSATQTAPAVEEKEATPAENPIEEPTETPKEAPTQIPTRVPPKTPTNVPPERPEPTATAEPSQPENPTDIEKEPYDSVGIWAITPDYLEFSLSEMTVEKVDDYFSKGSCFFTEPDPLQNKLHIVFNEQDYVATKTDDSSCWIAMDKPDDGLPEGFFIEPIMRITFYSEIDPLIPTQNENQPLTAASMFLAKMNCSKNPDSPYYSTTNFFIGGDRSYYSNDAGLTYIGPEHSSNKAKKKAFVLIVDLRPQSLGPDEKGAEQQRTPVYLYEYVFPDDEVPKNPIDIIHDALQKTANPGSLTDGTLNQELAEKNGKQIFFSCRLNKATPGFAIGGKDIEAIEGIRINVKFLYLIFETQYSIDNNLFEKHYNLLH